MGDAFVIFKNRRAVACCRRFSFDTIGLSLIKTPLSIFCNKKSERSYEHSLCGRSDKNRTCDLLNPIQARYQTALHPDGFLRKNSVFPIAHLSYHTKRKMSKRKRQFFCVSAKIFCFFRLFAKILPFFPLRPLVSPWKFVCNISFFPNNIDNLLFSSYNASGKIC